MRSNKKSAVLALAVAAAVAAPSAFATNGIMQVGNGMVAHGLGGAGIANAAEATSLADNPALATGLGKQGGIAASLFNPNRAANVGGGYVESDSEWFFIPQASYVNKIDDKSSWGIVAYAMGGMNTDYPAAIMGGMAGAGVDLMGLIVAPTYALKVSPNTSLGASLLLGYARLESTNVMTFMTSGTAPLATVSDSSTGTGVKLGLNTQLGKNTNLALVYQPKMNMSKMDNHCTGGAAPILAGTTFGGSADCKISLPPQIGAGISMDLGNGKLVADVFRYTWSDVDVFKSFGWEDQTVAKVGFEFGAGTTTWRIGLNHGKSPIDTAYAGPNVLFPAITETHVTVGFSRKMAGGGILTGYYLRAVENELTDNGSLGYSGMQIKMDQNAFGLGVNWSL